MFPGSHGVLVLYKILSSEILYALHDDVPLLNRARAILNFGGPQPVKKLQDWPPGSSLTGIGVVFK